MNDSTQITYIIKPLRRRLNAAVWLNAVLTPLLVIIASSGAILIVLKMFYPYLSWWAAAPLLFIPFVFVRGYIKSSRGERFFQPGEVVEIVDHLYRDDGSITASFENPKLIRASNFYDKVKKAVQKHLPRIDPAYYLKKMLPALAFIIIALILPARIIEEDPRSRQVVSAMIRPVVEKISQNKEFLTEAEQEELRETIEEIRKDAYGISREKWEAVEEVNERLENSLKQKEQNLQKMMSDVNRILNETNPSSQKAGETGSKDQLQEMLDNLYLSGKSMNLSAPRQQDIDRMLSEMQNGKNVEELRKQLNELKKELAKCCQGMNIDYLTEEQRMRLREGAGKGNGEGIGRGGVGRGRSDAPMVYGEEKKLPGAKYQDKRMQNRFLSGEDLTDLGITPVEPKPDPGRFSPGTVVKRDEVTGSQVSRTRISPGQKEVIQNYFSE